MVAGTDASAVLVHREVPGSVDVLDNAGDVCPLTISDVEDNLPPTDEEVGLTRRSIGHTANIHVLSPAQLIPVGSARSDHVADQVHRRDIGRVTEAVATGERRWDGVGT